MGNEVGRIKHGNENGIKRTKSCGNLQSIPIEPSKHSLDHRLRQLTSSKRTKYILSRYKARRTSCSGNSVETDSEDSSSDSGGFRIVTNDDFDFSTSFSEEEKYPIKGILKTPSIEKRSSYVPKNNSVDSYNISQSMESSEEDYPHLARLDSVDDYVFETPGVSASIRTDNTFEVGRYSSTCDRVSRSNPETDYGSFHYSPQPERNVEESDAKRLGKDPSAPFSRSDASRNLPSARVPEPLERTSVKQPPNPPPRYSSYQSRYVPLPPKSPPVTPLGPAALSPNASIQSCLVQSRPTSAQSRSPMRTSVIEAEVHPTRESDVKGGSLDRAIGHTSRLRELPSWKLKYTPRSRSADQRRSVTLKELEDTVKILDQDNSVSRIDTINTTSQSSLPRRARSWKDTVPTSIADSNDAVRPRSRTPPGYRPLFSSTSPKNAPPTTVKKTITTPKTPPTYRPSYPSTTPTNAPTFSTSSSGMITRPRFSRSTDIANLYLHGLTGRYVPPPPKYQSGLYDARLSGVSPWRTGYAPPVPFVRRVLTGKVEKLTKKFEKSIASGSKVECQISSDEDYWSDSSRRRMANIVNRLSGRAYAHRYLSVTPSGEVIQKGPPAIGGDTTSFRVSTAVAKARAKLAEAEKLCRLPPPRPISPPKSTLSASLENLPKSPTATVMTTEKNISTPESDKVINHIIIL